MYLEEADQTNLFQASQLQTSHTSCSWRRTLLKSRSQLALALTAGSTGGSSFGVLGKDCEIIRFNLYPAKFHERLYLIQASLFLG